MADDGATYWYVGENCGVLRAPSRGRVGRDPALPPGGTCLEGGNSTLDRGVDYVSDYDSTTLGGRQAGQRQVGKIGGAGGVDQVQGCVGEADVACVEIGDAVKPDDALDRLIVVMGGLV